jgi:adenosylcobinamide hydrolase
MRVEPTAWDLAACVWRFATPRYCIASAPFGGGFGLRSWVINAQVPIDYTRTDLDSHVREIARALGCAGDGVGMLTAASVRDAHQVTEAGIEVCVTVGLKLPTWAAAPADVAGERVPTRARPGTINLCAEMPVRLTPAALVNAVMTVTEAKAQALSDAGVPGTGTATDAVCIACPVDGPEEVFAGPRSRVGAPLARAVHAAISESVSG